MDQHADAGHEQQPDAGQRIEQESGIRLEGRRESIMLDVIQVAGIVPSQV